MKAKTNWRICWKLKPKSRWKGNYMALWTRKLEAKPLIKFRKILNKLLIISKRQFLSINTVKATTKIPLSYDVTTLKTKFLNWTRKNESWTANKIPKKILKKLLITAQHKHSQDNEMPIVTPLVISELLLSLLLGSRYFRRVVTFRWQKSVSYIDWFETKKKQAEVPMKAKTDWGICWKLKPKVR